METYGIRKFGGGWVVTNYLGAPINEPEATKARAFVEMIRMIADDHGLYINIKPSDV